MGDPLTREQLTEIQRLIDEQAEDEALWTVSDNIVEAYLQQELRRLTALVEAAIPHLSATFRGAHTDLNTIGRTLQDTAGEYEIQKRRAETAEATVRVRDEEITELRDVLKRWSIYWHSSGGLCKPPVDLMDRVLLARGDTEREL